jgi:hypothetical protein
MLLGKSVQLALPLYGQPPGPYEFFLTVNKKQDELTFLAFSCGKQNQIKKCLKQKRFRSNF